MMLRFVLLCESLAIFYECWLHYLSYLAERKCFIVHVIHSRDIVNGLARLTEQSVKFMLYLITFSTGFLQVFQVKMPSQ